MTLDFNALQSGMGPAIACILPLRMIVQFQEMIFSIISGSVTFLMGSGLLFSFASILFIALREWIRFLSPYLLRRTQAILRFKTSVEIVLVP